MSVDKRSVFTDATATLGQIIDETAARDAVHIAVEPVYAGATIFPGQSVAIKNNDIAVPVAPGEGVGIADPFLPAKAIYFGERFWLFVNPRTITSLRHVWAHPAFEGVAEPVVDKAASEAWLRNFVDQSDCPGYETVIAAALNDVEGYGDDRWVMIHGSDAHGKIPPEFWDHLEIVTGQTIPSDERAPHFSCSC